MSSYFKARDMLAVLSSCVLDFVTVSIKNLHSTSIGPEVAKSMSELVFSAMVLSHRERHLVSHPLSTTIASWFYKGVW